MKSIRNGKKFGRIARLLRLKKVLRNQNIMLWICFLTHPVPVCMLAIWPLIPRPTLSLDIKEPKVLMFFILLVTMLLDYRPNNMPFKREFIRQKPLCQLSRIFADKFSLLDLVWIGIAKFRLVSPITTNGHNLFSPNFMKKVWLIKRKFR